MDKPRAQARRVVLGCEGTKLTPRDTSHPMQWHMDGFMLSHPDQMAAHLRGEHGWTVDGSDRGDGDKLIACHYVAHREDGAPMMLDEQIDALQAAYDAACRDTAAEQGEEIVDTGGWVDWPARRWPSRSPASARRQSGSSCG